MNYRLHRLFTRVSLVGVLCTLASLLQAQTSLQITSPVDGSVVVPGTVLLVSVQTSGSTFTEVGVIGEEPLGVCDIVAGPPFQCSIQIPADIDLGTYSISAVGLDTSGNEADSTSITIDVEHSDTPVSFNAVELNVVTWVNPVSERVRIRSWLEEGAPPVEEWKLGKRP